MASEGNSITSSIWLRPAQRRGSGQPALSREQIVRVTIELLDADGLSGLSMRRLGARLGAGATSAYWHVTNKDGLLELAMDEVMSEVVIPDPASTGWRPAASAFAHGLRSMILRHSWITGLFGVRPNLGPNSMRLADRAIEVFTVGGFTGVQLTHASSLLSSHAIGSAATESAWRSAVARSGKTGKELMAELQPHLLKIGADYPNLDAWQRDNYGNSMDLDTLNQESFDFGVERILDGLQAWLDNPPGKP